MERCGRSAVLLLLLTTSLSAQAVRPGLEPRVPIGKNLAPAGLLLVRTSPERPWTYAESMATLDSRDRLLALPGTRAELETTDGKVGVTLAGNVPQLSQFAGFQSEVVLHDSRSFDLDFTLVAGRVIVTARKAGPIKVWVRLPSLIEGRTRPPEEGSLQLTLAEAGDSVALDIHGRWPRGVAFTNPPRPDATPTALLNVLVLKGRVELKTSSHQYALSAPPGPASLSWDSEGGPGGPQRVDQLPDWVGGKTEGTKTVEAVYKRYAAARAGREPVPALLELIAGSDKDDEATRAILCRQFAIVSLGALDELPRVVGAVELARWPEVRDVAIVTLRHYIGGMAGRDATLFQVLREGLNYPQGVAEAMLQLLHSPFDPEAPETYSALLAYLRHPRTAVREMARWHLDRYLPEGKKISFDATADEATRDRAIQAWKTLIEERQKK